MSERERKRERERERERTRERKREREKTKKKRKEKIILIRINSVQKKKDVGTVRLMLTKKTFLNFFGANFFSQKPPFKKIYRKMKIEFIRRK